MFTSIVGTVVVVKQMSIKDRLKKKKYTGVWRWESELVAKMISRFPIIVTRCMDRNNPKRNSCSLGSSVWRVRRNSGTVVWFSPSMARELFLQTQDKNSKQFT
jgi:hypothetical protein